MIKATVGLMAILRDEGYFIEEWLWFHHLAGVERFYITLHNNTDDTRQRINRLPFKDSIRIYTLTGNDRTSRYQYHGFDRMMSKHRDEVEWMIMCDADEFMFNPQGISLKKILKPFEQKECGGIIVPWTVFGIGGFVGRPPLPITDHIVLTDGRPSEAGVKSIVRTKYYQKEYAHVPMTTYPFVYQDGTTYTGDYCSGRRIEDKIKCHHYYVRGMQDIVRRAKYKSFYQHDLWTAFKQESAMNVTNEDATIYSEKIKIGLGIPQNDATKKNTVFLSVADYPNPEEKAYGLITTAEHSGFDITWASYGDEFKSFYESKYIKVLSALKTQKKKGNKYAFFLDGDDTLVLTPLSEILKSFNRIYKGGVIFCCDYTGVMWPQPNRYLQWHIQSNYGKNGLISTCGWCGLIDDIITVIEQIIDVREQILNENYKDLCTKIFANINTDDTCNNWTEFQNHLGTRRLIDDDQWLMHILQLEYNPLIHVDQYKQLFASVDQYSPYPRSVFGDRDCLGTAKFLHSTYLQKGNKRIANPNWINFANWIADNIHIS